jgi:hypothetical protein
MFFSWDIAKALKNYEKHGIRLKKPAPYLVILGGSNGPTLNTLRTKYVSSVSAPHPKAAYLSSFIRNGG